MSQVLHTKYCGDIEIDMSWQNGILHIARLANDKGYVHITGIPVNNKQEIEECIPAGIYQEAALRWFEHRDELPEKPKKEIIIKNDGSFEFSDGTKITNVADLVENLPAGPVLDAAYEWFKAGKIKKHEEEEKLQSTTGQIMQKIVGKSKKDEGQ
jgi:hypothetical protein